jgi:hypothetical protein
VRADHRLHFHDARGDLDQAQAQRVELREAPLRLFWHRDAQAPHDPSRRPRAESIATGLP